GRFLVGNLLSARAGRGDRDRPDVELPRQPVLDVRQRPAGPPRRRTCPKRPSGRPLRERRRQRLPLLDQPAYLIVNADDYGYFPCVSRGILAPARQRAVTATGVMANAPSLDQQLDWLKSCPDLDTGVHLNLTWGTPLSRVMRDRLRRSGGRFMSKERMCSAILRHVVTIAEVGAEWQSQIEKCLAAGLRPSFLNSHEHIHMLPPLFSLIHDLAAKYGIAHVRYPVGEVPRRWTIGAVARNLIIHCLARLCRSR